MRKFGSLKISIFLMGIFIPTSLERTGYKLVENKRVQLSTNPSTLADSIDAVG